MARKPACRSACGTDRRDHSPCAVAAERSSEIRRLGSERVFRFRCGAPRRRQPRPALDPRSYARQLRLRAERDARRLQSARLCERRRERESSFQCGFRRRDTPERAQAFTAACRLRSRSRFACVEIRDQIRALACDPQRRHSPSKFREPRPTDRGETDRASPDSRRSSSASLRRNKRSPSRCRPGARTVRSAGDRCDRKRARGRRGSGRRSPHPLSGPRPVAERRGRDEGKRDAREQAREREHAQDTNADGTGGSPKRVAQDRPVHRLIAEDARCGLGQVAIAEHRAPRRDRR